MATSAFLEQIEQKIYILQNQGKLAEAYDLCKLYISQYPEEKSLHTLKAELEESIEDKNNRIIDEKLKKIAPLWQEKAYSKIIKELKELLKYAPTHKEANKQYQTALEKYKSDIEIKNNEYEKAQTEKLEKLLENNENNLINELYLLELGNPGNETTKALIKTYKNKLIQKKINERKELINSDKFNDIENFLNQLEKIDNESEIIKNEKQKIKIKRNEKQKQEKEEFVYQGITHLDTLMKLEKYDKVMKAAKEILESDPTNREVKIIHEKAKEKLFSQTRETTITKIIESQNTTKEDVKAHEDQYISI